MLTNSQLKALIEGTATRFGRLDCLFNNAGYGILQRSIVDLDIAEYDAMMSVVLRAVMLGMKFAAPIMLRQRSGCIINTGSIAAHRSGLSSQTYSVAKAGVVHATRCVAAELGESNIRVNSISPGAIVTGVFAKGIGIDSNVADRHLATVTKRFAQAQPIPRAGLPEDIARAALFLASDAGSFVNGIDLVVDGGVITGNRFSAGAAARARACRRREGGDRKLATGRQRACSSTLSDAFWRRYPSWRSSRCSCSASSICHPATRQRSSPATRPVLKTSSASAFRSGSIAR